jgi:membrane-bound lytic murein transglycosylase D
LQQEHPYIERWIEFFTQTEKGRSFFSRSLERMALYGPHIARWLEENGLPSKLVWLAFIESGLNPHALSRARAKGIWQFIRSTGKRYNLRRNAYLDERSDPYLSTVAASRYLRDLYLSYRSWELALAAYNAGERRIDRASRKAGHNDYWQMLHHPHRLLPRETKHYVPKMIAAYRIGTDLERYGFSLTSPPSPLTWETISVPGGISLAELSRRVGIPEDLLIGLNPALRRRMTPPGGSYPLRVPPGQGEEMLRVAVTLPALNAPLPFSEDHYIVYRVKRGDTLWKISRRFGIPISAIRDENDLQTSRLRPGQTLYLPKAGGRPLTARKTDTYIRASGEIRYRVQKGDTLWTIAKRFGVPLKDLIRHNQLDPRKPLPVGHLIRIPPFSES